MVGHFAKLAVECLLAIDRCRVIARRRVAHDVVHRHLIAAAGRAYRLKRAAQTSLRTTYVTAPPAPNIPTLAPQAGLQTVNVRARFE